MPKKLTEIEAWEVVRKTFYKVNACQEEKRWASYCEDRYRCAETGTRHYGMCSVVDDLCRHERITEAVGERMFRKIQASLLDQDLYLYDTNAKGAAKRRSFCNARIKELKNG